jgi:hypothetical protein
MAPVMPWIEKWSRSASVTIAWRFIRFVGCLRYRSLHAMAGYTYSEGNAPLHRVRISNFWPAPLQGMGKGWGFRISACHWSPQPETASQKR